MFITSSLNHVACMIITAIMEVKSKWRLVVRWENFIDA